MDPCKNCPLEILCYSLTRDGRCSSREKVEKERGPVKNCKNCLHSECGNYKKDKNTYCYQFLTAKIHLDLMDKNALLHTRIIELENRYEPKRYIVSSCSMVEGRTKFVIHDTEDKNARVMELAETFGIHAEAIVIETCEKMNGADKNAKKL